MMTHNTIVLSVYLILWSFTCARKQWEYPARYYEWVNNTFINNTMELHPHAPARSVTFETDPPQERWKNRGTAGQDLMLIDVFQDKESGYFVDLAANQYQDSSNTYLMETFNKWRGICIEANPLYHLELLGFRRCKLYINPVSDESNKVIRFKAQARGGAGIVHSDFMNKSPDDNDLVLTTTTLELILDHARAPSVMDYLSLDIEGAEYDAMKNFPFHRYLFLMVTVERPSMQLHKLMARHGYHYVQVMAHFGEVLYFHRAMPKFHRLMMKHGKNSVPEWSDSGTWENMLPRLYLLHPRYPGFQYNQTEIALAEQLLISKRRDDQ